MAFTALAVLVEPCVAATAASAPELEEGRALYEGRHPALSATLPGASHAALPVQQAACVATTGPAGSGSFEGEAAVPPISSGLLARPFDPATTRRYGPAARPGEEGGLRVRPAYDAAALHRLLTEGRTPDGRVLGPLMPRYALRLRHGASLLAFLNALGTQPTPGVDDDVVHFATITGDDVPSPDAADALAAAPVHRAQERADARRRTAARRRPPYRARDVRALPALGTAPLGAARRAQRLAAATGRAVRGAPGCSRCCPAAATATGRRCTSSARASDCRTCSR
ncbi:MAG: hypothetical protein U1F67_09770 [Rubrivivax sp.]